MTERYDPKLVEAVAAAFWNKREPGWWPPTSGTLHTQEWREAMVAVYREAAEAALAEIDASGTHWVAPSSLPESIKRWYAHTQTAIDFEWRQIRDACLAERRGEGR